MPVSPWAREISLTGASVHGWVKPVWARSGGATADATRKDTRAGMRSIFSSSRPEGGIGENRFQVLPTIPGDGREHNGVPGLDATSSRRVPRISGRAGSCIAGPDRVAFGHADDVLPPTSLA